MLDGGTSSTPVYLVINQNNSAGIARLPAGGHIHSENQYNFVKWQSGTSIGNYIFPFGVGGAATDYIPFTFNKTTAGSSDIDMATWTTDTQNLPHAAATNVGPVTNMTGAADSVLYAIDRFWDIQTSSAVTADLTFSYLGIENTTSTPTDTVKAMHWNGTSWDTPVGVGTQGVITGVGTAGPFLAQSTFSPWILSIVAPCPTAVISYPSDYCNNDTNLQAINFSGGLGGKFTSTLTGLALDSLTGSIVPANSSPGTYTVIYTLDSTAVCPVFMDSATVTIHSTSSIAQNMSICQGDSILLGGVFQTTAGIYIDTLINGNNCDSIISTTLNINPIITTQINDSICQGDSIFLGGAFQTTAGTYNDTLVSSTMCDSIIATTLFINALPLITTSNDISVCPNINVNIAAFGANTYFWDNGLGAGQNYNVTPLNTTTYIVTGTGTNGCSDTASVTVTIIPGTVTIADAGSDITLCVGDPVNLSGNTPIVGETGLWSTNGTGVITSPNNPTTSVTGLTIGSYYFTWIITNSLCSPTMDSVNIVIESCDPSNILIPNVFTPNSDGSNDIFTVNGNNLESVECEIFNRWGQLLYSWNNINGAWDGRTSSGAEVPDGTYFYIITAKGLDGTEYFKKGTFSLIR